MTKKLISVLVTSITLAGCAGVTYEPGYMHKDGWRSATVDSIGSGPEYLEKLAGSCTGRTSDKLYAKVKYSDSHLRWRSYPLKPDSSLQAGDQVLISITECAIVLRPGSK
jgi:hypothetical protein